MNDSNGTITVLSGGFPCQPISVAGNRLGCKDERWMWNDYYRIIKETEPKWIIIENSTRLLKIHEWKGIQSDLERAGYQFICLRLSAKDIGAPHIRRRVFIVANSYDKSMPQDDKKILPIREEWNTWKDVTCNTRGDVQLPDWKTHIPTVCRMDDGVPFRVDKPRLQALGNAIVPRVIYPIFKAIGEIENG